MSLTRHCTGTKLTSKQLPLALTLLPGHSDFTIKFTENFKKEEEEDNRSDDSGRSSATNHSDTDFSPYEHSIKGEERDLNENVDIADLQVVWQLGEGLQGTVYLVKHKNHQRKYALKVCHHLTTTPRKNNVDEIRNEAMVLKQLSHPFIVNLNTFLETPKHTYLLLDFCPGGDLFYHMRKVEESERKRFSENTVKFYVWGLILALQYLHDKGFIYRDLKPENVLIDRDGYPKLWDFGLSISQGDIDFKTCRKQCGTKGYFSPEILNRQLYGPEVDWWTLGILTYELLFGKTPFAHDNVFTENNNIRHASPSFTTRDDLSLECIDFISKLLSKDGSKRLGANGIQDFKSHPWLEDVDWDKLESKWLDPPYQLRCNMTSDTQYFSDTFTTKSVTDEFLFDL